jgi:hypothetical protein
MPEKDGAAAGGEGRAEEGSHIDARDRVLGADGNDVRAGDVVVAVHEERGEMLAIGQRDERVKGAGAGARVGKDCLGEAKGTAGLHEAYFVARPGAQATRPLRLLRPQGQSSSPLDDAALGRASVVAVVVPPLSARPLLGRDGSAAAALPAADAGPRAPRVAERRREV